MQAGPGSMPKCDSAPSMDVEKGNNGAIVRQIKKGFEIDAESNVAEKSGPAIWVWPDRHACQGKSF